MLQHLMMHELKSAQPNYAHVDMPEATAGVVWSGHPTIRIVVVISPFAAEMEVGDVDGLIP